MNSASRWRYDIAKHLAQLYSTNPRIAAVILGGSTARGHADRYSDVELGVFWHHDPTHLERQTVIQSADADLIRLYDYDQDEQVWCDDFMIGRDASEEPHTGLLVEVSHYTTDFMAQTLHQVLNEYATHELSHNLISGVVDSLPLYGSNLIQAWQKQAAQYPRPLAVAIVQKHAVIDHFWRWEMYLERGENLPLIYQSFAQIHQRLLHVLLGLNRVYYFGFKWIEEVDSRLKIKPNDLLLKLRHPYESLPAEGAQQIIRLVEDIYDLVETHLPEINIERLREIFRYRRPQWDNSPLNK